MGIVFNNAIRNAGQMPKIQATTDINTIVGQNNSLALDTANNLLFYWDPNTPEWVPLSGAAALTLQQVLSNGNVSTGIPLAIIGQNISIANASLLVADATIDGQIVVNAVGIKWTDLIATETRYQVYKDATTGDIYQKVLSDTGGTTILQPSAIATDVNVIYPNTSGQMYNLVFASITLIAGVGTYVVSGGSNSNILGIYVSGVNASTQIGVNYKWTKFGNLITITSLKSNGATETSDVSTLNISIAK